MAPDPVAAPPVLVLASTSPRRRLILTRHGYPHETVHPGLDDAQLSIPPGSDPERWTAGLAYLKARSAAREIGDRPCRVILGADTIVVKGDEVIGQPTDEADARRILQTLENGWHRVISGAAVLAGDRRWILSDEARVRVGHLGEALIGPYARSGQWRGKAGAYNLMERIEAGWPIDFEGDPDTIMGLPINVLRPILDPLLRTHGGAAA